MVQQYPLGQTLEQAFDLNRLPKQVIFWKSIQNISTFFVVKKRENEEKIVKKKEHYPRDIRISFIRKMKIKENSEKNLEKEAMNEGRFLTFLSIPLDTPRKKKLRRKLWRIAIRKNFTSFTI